jgi:hypothetical protein
MYIILILKEIILYLSATHTYDYVMTLFSKSDHLNKEDEIFACEWLNHPYRWVPVTTAWHVSGRGGLITFHHKKK